MSQAHNLKTKNNRYKNSLLSVSLCAPQPKDASVQNISPKLEACADKLTEEKPEKSLYKRVLTFPDGTDHLKYFEHNPHPGKIPDKLLALEELASNPDLNVSLLNRIFEFDMVKKFLEPKLSDKDKKILLMPDKMRRLINTETNEEYLKAFTHLRDSFYNYFSTPTDDSIRPDIQWIEYPFATNYPPAQQALQELRNNLFNTKAINKLVEKLHEAGAFGDERKDFYFWNTEPYNWSDISYQARSVKSHGHVFPTSSDIHKLPPQYLALGDFTINAIPEGYVLPKGNGKYDICVNKMYFFVNDSFNFEGLEYLGPWNLENETESSLFTLLYKGTHLSNGDFSDFQRHGYGRYFPVLSKLHEMENFQPKCLEYHLAK